MMTSEPAANQLEVSYQAIKSDLHERLIESLDLASIDQADSPQMRAQILLLARELLPTTLALETSDRLMGEIEDEVFGLGPLEPLLRDKTVSDILVNGPYEVRVERAGRLKNTSVVFADEAHLRRVIHRIVSRVGRRIDEVSPMVDARLADGSRVNAVVAPLALNGPLLSIRKFDREHLDIQKLIANGTLSGDMAEFLLAAVRARINMVVSGGTGAGKTTLLNALSAGIPDSERLVTIEDSAELQLRHRHVAKLETRPANSEGLGEITQRDLVKNSLRMRPDRIIIGEVRGAEALDMLQAMNTGHEGSLTTLHANDTTDALTRLEMMVAMTGVDYPVTIVRQYIASGIRLLLQVARLSGGVRRIVRITEITGFKGSQYQTQDLFVYRQRGLDVTGVAKGIFESTGALPTMRDRFEDHGVALQDNWFRFEEDDDE
jgi:pilus assembly protein CpaF